MKYGTIRTNDVLARIRAAVKASGARWRFDRDIAAAIGIDPNGIATHRHRGTLPLEEIALFAYRKRLSLNWLLFGQDREDIRDGIITPPRRAA